MKIILPGFLTRHSWAALTWTLLIIIGCTLPGKDLPGSPMVGFDKIVHTGLFIGWTFLWRLRYPHRALRILLLGIFFGTSLEFYQQWLPFDRTFDWWDAAADALGAGLGNLLYQVARPWLRSV